MRCAAIVLSFFVSAQAQAQEPGALTIGMFAYRPVPILQSSWGGFASYLETWLPGTRVNLRFLDQDDMAAALTKGELDLVFTNPVHYIQLRSQNALSGAIATLATLDDDGKPVPYVSGAVIRRKERGDISRWEDLPGKVVAVTGGQYLGGYAAQAKELIDRGIALDSIVFKSLGNPHDRVVAAVLAGDADAGFVRSGVLESLAHAGAAEVEELVVIERVPHPAFPFMSSTALYPEWPMVALPQLDRDISRRISAALLAFEPNDVLRRSSDMHGFVIPSDYQAVKDAMMAARIPPFDRPQSITLSEFVREHALTGAALGLVLLTLFSATAWVARGNRKLAQAQSRLTHELRRLDNVIKGSNAGTWELCFPEDRLAFDGRWAEMLGYTLDELPQGAAWKRLVHPLDMKKVQQGLDALMEARSESFDTEFRMRHKSGNWIWVGSHGSVIQRTEDGSPVLLTGMSLDVSERKRLEEERRLSHIVFLQTHAGVLVTDKNNLIMQVNPAFTQITGYSRDEVLGKPPGFLSSGYHGKDFYRELWSTLKKSGKWMGEIVNRHKSGHTFVGRISIAEVRDQDGDVSHYIAIFTDISLQKQLIAELRHSANHDMLTGLPNRSLLHDRINQAVAQARRSRKGMAIIFLDLDGFKPVNDTHGHAVGDVLLRNLAARMRKVIREGDTVARAGGDEFVVVVNGLDREGAIKCAKNVLAAIDEPVDLQGAVRTAQVSASLGVLVCEPMILADFVGASECLLEQADMLMYQAKRAGGARMVVQSLNRGDCQADSSAGGQGKADCPGPGIVSTVPQEKTS